MNFKYILADYAYKTTDIYDYVFDNTHSTPVIAPNKRWIIIEKHR